MRREELRARLRARRGAEASDGHAFERPDAALEQGGRRDVFRQTVGTAALIPAAVLVGLVPGPDPGVLLTRRQIGLRQHSGQVAFPGGRIDPGDRDAEAAALREAREEIALDPSRVELVGRLRDSISGTGFRVTPILGIIEPGGVYEAAPLEVDAIFQLPLSILLNETAPVRSSIEVDGATRRFWVWPHPDHYIWGLTAHILLDLAERLRAGVLDEAVDRSQHDWRGD